MASVSAAERIIAARPPYIKNVRKIRASEKLIANLERGSGKLILGAKTTAITIASRNPHVHAERGIVTSARMSSTAPSEIVTILVLLKTVSRVIEVGPDSSEGKRGAGA